MRSDRIKELELEIESLKLQIQLKQLEVEMAKHGLSQPVNVPQIHRLGPKRWDGAPEVTCTGEIPMVPAHTSYIDWLNW